MKKITLIFLGIFVALCLGLDCWFGVLVFSGKTKIDSDTFIVGNETVSRVEDGAEVTEERQFIEANLFDDVFELKFNCLLDENKEFFYSYGLQFVSDGEELDFGKTFSTVVRTETLNSSLGFNWGFKQHKYFNRLLANPEYKNIQVYNYMQDGISEKNFTATNTIDSDFFFKVDIDGTVYGMKFKNDDVKIGDQNSVFFAGTSNFNNTVNMGVYQKDETYYEYRTADIYLLSELIFNSIKNSELSPGTTSASYFNFPDIFNYYKFDGKNYSNDPESESDILTSQVSSFYAIKFSIHEGKMENSNESLFKMRAGSWNYSNGVSGSDYFSGENLIRLTEKDFDWIETGVPGEYLLSLPDSLKKSISGVKLYIFIDLDFLKSCNITVKGFVENTFSGFEVVKIDYSGTPTMEVL